MTSFGCRHAPTAIAPAARDRLVAAYSEPHRAYHTLAHIAAMLRWFDTISDELGWRDPAAVYVAVLCHDAIYDPLAKDNEARSAQLAEQLLGATPRTRELIELTARHGSVTASELAGDVDAQLFLDCDTAILGADEAAFDAYDAGVAFEYKVVPRDAYRAGRRAFLTKMLQQPRIFFSEYFHARLDDPARANLARALARLS